MALARPKGTHPPGRRAVRRGRKAGSVTLGGRWVPVDRTRVRATDGSGELSVPASEPSPPPISRGAGAGARDAVWRHNHSGREPVGAEVTARPPRSRRSPAGSQATERPSASGAPGTSSPLDLESMVERVHFGDHLCVVGIDGTESPRPLEGRRRTPPP